MSPATSDAAIRRLLSELIASWERFNSRWLAYVNDLDLERVNRLRDGYNRYYLLEKECAIRSSRTAGAGFVPLPAVSVEDVLAEFPLLKVPQIRDDQ